MSPTTLEVAAVPNGYAARRAVALSNVKLFRKLAWRALRDDLPKSESRAANARQAARIILAAAKREAMCYRRVREILSADA